MARINLLPWRAERRKQREREFYMMLAAAGAAAMLVLFVTIYWMDSRVENQNNRNAYLQQEIKGLDKKIEEIKELEKTRSQLLARKQIIEDLQANRSQMVHLFDELVKTMPDGTRLTSLKQAGDRLTLEGVAESNARVASYMRAIDKSPWMGRSDLGKIENKSGSTAVDRKMPQVFSLSVGLRKPEEVTDELPLPDTTPPGEVATQPAAETATPPTPAATAPAEESKP